MNYKALTQAARNVFREWFTAIRSHMPLLAESHRAIATRMFETESLLLFCIPTFGPTVALFLGISSLVADFPPRCGEFWYPVFAALASGAMLTGFLGSMYFWIEVISHAELEQHRREEADSEDRRY